uniref:B-related factor 1 n=1 Tax=Biomphalaria glabrata TaxID=6526 RepID=A0A2C9L0G2_BIOGL
MTGSRAQTFRGAYGHGFSSEDSRKLTLENGYRRLKEIGSQLRMHHSSIETAFGFFKLAVAHRFTSGRKMEYVLASCLYLVCRVDPGGSEDLELMLIDFSDLIQVNVHVLGRIFVQLATELSQNIRIVDPIIYIRRFANQLHFGDKLNRVVESASRLVARMKRDWMHTGRRPAGLCGAALLISSRMHNFNRTIDQIIRVVKVCESTVRKRLLEFESTPSAQLTIEEFDNVDLEEEQDPPCFTEGKKKAKLAQLKEEIPDTMIKEMNKFEKNISKSLKRNPITLGIAARKCLEIRLAKQLVFVNNRICYCKIKYISCSIFKNIFFQYIDQLIVTEEEASHKAKWFDLEFGAHMEIVRDREEKRRIKEEATAKRKEKNQKKEKKGGYDLETELAECMEILKKDMREKKFSDKINYNVLNTLDAFPSQSEPVIQKPIEILDDNVKEVQKDNRHLYFVFLRLKKSGLEINEVKKPSNKRVRLQDKGEIEEKKPKITTQEELKPVIIIDQNSSVLPLEEDDGLEDVEDEEDEDDEYDEDEDSAKILSARQLLSQEVSAYDDEDDYYGYDIH